MENIFPYDLTPNQEHAIKDIYKSFENNINVICSLPSGGGKTVITCAIIRELMEQGQCKILIIVKAGNLYDPWIKELTKSGIKYSLIHGIERLEKRLNGRYEMGGRKVLLTSHGIAALDIDYFTQMGIFDLVIIDEIHTIINPKKITNKTKEFSHIAASKRLFLTATPIQNSKHDIGLIHILLNNPEKIITLDQNYTYSNKILSLAYKDAIIKNIVVQPGEKKENADYVFKQHEPNKSKIILTIPLYKEMEDFILKNKGFFFGENLLGLSSSKRLEQFLSHPKSIYKNNSVIKDTVRCTKVDAVEFIIRNTLDNEKVIVFSRYKDVLYQYYVSLKNIGYNSIMVTGEDRNGKDLNRKLNLFKMSGTYKVLLTTLFKSAEGINLPEANHVIILEFWWNPQRIFQAIGRIDRYNQKRNIFTYLLCYNKDGHLYGQDIAYFDKMREKKEQAKEIIHSQEDFPDVKVFINEMIFKDELKSFLIDFTNPKIKSHFSKNTEMVIDYDEIVKMEKIKEKQEEEEERKKMEDMFREMIGLYYQNDISKQFDDLDLEPDYK